MLRKILIGLFLCGFSSVLYADEPNDLKYAEALKKSEKEEKPLIVFVSAKWCPSCVKMKAETVESMKKDGSFKEVVVTVVDVDNEPELAKQLYLFDELTKEQKTSIPQMIVFGPPNRGHKKFGLIGNQTKHRVLELIGKVLKNDRGTK